MPYNVYRDGSLVAENVEQTSYTDTGLEPSTTYSYEITEVINGEESSFSNAVSITTDAQVPEAPTNVTEVSTTSTSAELMWE